MNFESNRHLGEFENPHYIKGELVDDQDYLNDDIIVEAGGDLVTGKPQNNTDESSELTNHKQELLARFLQNKKFLFSLNVAGKEVLVFDSKNFKDLMLKGFSHRRYNKHFFNVIDFINFLSSQKAVEIQELNNLDDSNKIEELVKPILRLPKTIDEVTEQTFLQYSSILNLEDLIKTSWKAIPELNKGYLVLEDGSRVTYTKLFTMSAMRRLGVEYQPHLSEQQNFECQKTIQYFVDVDILQRDGQNYVINKKSFRQFLNNRKKPSFINNKSILQSLSMLKGYATEDLDRAQELGMQIKPNEFLALPPDINSLFGKGYYSRYKTSMFKFRDISKVIFWNDKVCLPSGEKINLAELGIVSELQALGFHRINDQAFIKDPITNEKTPFSAQNFSKLSNLGPISVTHYYSPNKSKKLSFKSNPTEFFYNYLPNIKKFGMLEPNDFKTHMSEQGVVNKYGAKEKKLSPTDPYVGFSSKGGKFVSYFLGRGKLVGLEELNVANEDIFVTLLDNQTAVILQKNGQEKIPIGQFKLLSADESNFRYMQKAN